MLNRIACGDLELNLAHPFGSPTLVPSPGLEQRLDWRCGGGAAATGPDGLQLASSLAVHLHVYYPDTVTPLLRRLEQCQGGLGRFDLWLTCDSSQKAAQLESSLTASSLCSSVEAVQMRVFPNRGRNLGPLLRELWPELRQYGLLLHLHGKRSVETALGIPWLAQLLETLLPDAHTVNALRHCFASQDDLGLVMPQPPAKIRPYLNWGNNFELAQQLMQRQLPKKRLSRDGVLMFPAGMMFWCRPAALEPLAAIAQALPELPPEPLPVDGTSLHALERLVGHSCEAVGLRWALMCPQAPPSGTSQAQLSLWESNPQAYQQATAAIAALCREQWELRLCADRNFSNCQQQLETADQQIRRLMELVQQRDAQLAKLELHPLIRIIKLIQRLGSGC